MVDTVFIYITLHVLINNCLFIVEFEYVFVLPLEFGLQLQVDQL